MQDWIGLEEVDRILYAMISQLQWMNWHNLQVRVCKGDWQLVLVQSLCDVLIRALCKCLFDLFAR